MMQEELKQYESDAKEYRSTLTMIVRHHYEERRRRVLTALDREIKVEQKELGKARDLAIRRLEEFIALYSGRNAHPVATPDAMFRLAALYEERARANFDADLGETLQPAIALYLRIIREYPSYEQIAGVYYFLGHAYTDATRLEEGQQAWRSLVCSNHFEVKEDSAHPGHIVQQPLPQDHDEKFWTEWYNRHPIPLDQEAAVPKKTAKKAPAGKKKNKKAEPEEPQLASVEAEELRFKNPYPEDCTIIAQQVEQGEEPKYVAEAWWQVGNYHFDQIDVAGGPYELNRSMSAYEHSMQYKKPPIYGVSMYKRAWTYVKQQRYRPAVEWFVNLLHYADEEEERTGDAGADFRSEAYTYIAGSLTYVDFDGPPADYPAIPRSDVLDTETNPVVAEQKMHIAIDRVQDPKLIPQDKKWTVEIYKALAREFIEITQNRNAIAVLEVTLKKFPMDRDAPMMQNKVADIYDELARLAPDKSAAKEEYAAKALEARTRLADYVGATPWTDANRDDPEALQKAEELVRGGLQRAAADHTNSARALFQRANELTDEGEQRATIEKAIAEYRLAELAWSAYIEQDPAAFDAYDSRFWLADARYWIVVLQVAIGRTPKPDEVEGATQAAIDVRDSNEDDKYMQPAGYYTVSIAEKVLEDRYHQYDVSHGTRGIPKRTEVRFEGTGDARKPVTDPVPPEVIEAIRARDEYNARIPLDRDPQRNGLLYAFQAGDYFFAYGHFDEAADRFKPLYDAYCGKNEFGYKAWEKLISMSNFRGDAEQSRRLAEAKSCAFNEETKRAEEAIRTPVRQGVAYLDARKLYDDAEKMPEGPERTKKWREAAAAYKVALDAAPDRDEAPEAAMNGAFAYKQVGEYDKAIEMYELFISRYGSEEKLASLKNGDPNAQPPKLADPKKYADRVRFLNMAYEALASARVLFFDYPKAAETFDRIANVEHFDPQTRRHAAKQALNLYASLGDTTAVTRAKSRFFDLGASPQERAEADFIIANADVKKWDEFSPDTGSNAAARQRAQASMRSYYDKNKGNPAAAQYIVHAAYYIAKTKKAGNETGTDDWWNNTMKAYDQYRVVAPRGEAGTAVGGSAESAMAAEAAYTLIDQDVQKSFDYDTGHHHYKGTPLEVVKKYQEDAIAAKQWYDRLQRVTDYYASPEWAAASLARQGSLYDSLRTGLYNARPPDLKMFDAKTEALLKRAEESSNPDLQEKADAMRINVETAWRNKRDQELDSADRVMVDRYANAVVVARRYNVSNPAVVRAIQRLAFFTDVVGEAKLGAYTAGIRDLGYSPGMFLRIRPGLVEAPKPQGMPPPLPVLPQ